MSAPLPARQKHAPPSRFPGRSLGLKLTDRVAIAELLRTGLDYSAVVKLQKFSGFGLDVFVEAMQIPARTLARRKFSGRLSGHESERLYRLALLIEGAVDLFEGDTVAARTWLQTPHRALAQHTPLQLMPSEIGAREVEALIGRLNEGVFS